MKNTVGALRKVFKKLTKESHFERNELLQMMAVVYILDVEIGISQTPDEHNSDGSIILYFKKQFPEETDIFGTFTPSITISALRNERLSLSTRPQGLEVNHSNLESLQKHLLISAEIVRLVKEEL